MLREIFVALAVGAAFATPASACPDQKGKVIFEDTFTDDSGGWELYAPVSEIKDGSLRLHPNLADGDDKNTRVLNQTFSAVDGDYCVEFVLPAKLDPVNSIAFSLLFFAQNVDNMFMWQASSQKITTFWKKSSGTWTALFTEKTLPAPINLEPNAVNSLRVVAKDGKFSLYLNGGLVKAIRAQTPAGELHFGVRAELDKPNAGGDPFVLVKSIKVTTGQ